MDYTYILFWNSVWTIAPVIGIGLFDRVLGTSQHPQTTDMRADTRIDSHILMELPEVYHYGRRGAWFGLTSFFMYMLDGVVQVSFYILIVVDLLKVDVR
jgi:phospholipid-translocating ATPase